jgi:menaquinone-9 beta-reductase
VAVPPSFDVVIVGGGIAGSVLAGVLARSGVSVMIAEKESRFRDRVRGEATHPWGVAETHRLGVETLFGMVGSVDLVGMGIYEGGALDTVDRWDTKSGHGLGAIAFSHPRMQEAALGWAQSQGAKVHRPMKVLDCAAEDGVTVTISDGAAEQKVRARLVVGADGKTSSARRWTGGQSRSDPEHHRFGGVQVAGVQTQDRDTSNVAGPVGGGWVNWFAQGPGTTRLYVCATAEFLREHRIDRSFDALTTFVAGFMPDGALSNVRQEGPMGFLANSDTWASQICGNGVVLVGDAAGSADPTFGHGTALAFRDVRELSDLLLTEDNWAVAIEEYAARRRAYFDVIHRVDQWNTVLEMQLGDDADAAREGHAQAKAVDPAVGGFEVLAARGPDGLTADATARATFFGRNAT